MKKIFLSVTFGFLGTLIAFGQGTVRGKITDGNGESVIGAIIVLKSNRSVGTTADLDGNYSLKITDSTAQTLVISSIGFKTIEEEVNPKKGEIIMKNFTLKSATQEIKEVEVSAKAIKSREYFTEAKKRNSATTLDYISSETIKKTGDANVTAAVARVAGVSTNGSFITVRGIGDRYVKTSINGSRIPTLDPFTNNIKLDLFPASLVDNVIITKTASPDLPGDFAGAYISVETKDYPEQLTINVESSFGYNPQTSFKDILTSQRSSTDWLGYDNNFRQHTHDDFVPNVPDPTLYQEFVALGLGNYFNSLGVTNANWNENSDMYHRLGLIQIGLLAPAQINDDVAFQNAVTAYNNGTYSSDAFQVINATVPESGKSFPNNWNTFYKRAGLNLSEGFSIGNQTKLFGKPFGFLFGYRYGSSVLYDPDATSNRASVDANLLRTKTSIINEHTSKETNGWSGLINLAWKFSPNNNFSVLFMPNFTGVNNVRYSLDTADSLSSVTITQSQFYEQRKQLVYQFNTEHFLPGPKIKAELNASYTNGKSSAPDFKNLQYILNADNTYQIGEGTKEGIRRYYRYLDDNLFDSRISFEIPVKEKPSLTRKVKVGGAYQRNDRKYDQYEYFIAAFGNDKSPLINGDIDQFLSPDEFEIHTGTDINGQQYSSINAYYERINSPANHTFGNSEIIAGFAMLDYSITDYFRFSGGLRVEHSEIFTDVFVFDSLGLAPNDPRRQYKIGYPAANPGKLNETSYLPSVNFIYKLKNDESAPVNLRINYSKTIARPSIRELSDIAVFDYEYRALVTGNSDLKMVNIDNYDLRLESYFKSGDNISASLFYKNFKNHIELINSIGVTWQNVDKSRVEGIELEGKKILSKHFDVRANVTLVNSRTTFVRTFVVVDGSGVKTYIPQDTVERAMFGQSPYVMNGILSYTSDSLGLSAALSYNVQGPRLVISSSAKEIPDIYELQRHLIDFKVTKSIGKHFNAAVTVRDLLNTSIRRAYKYPEGYTLDYDKYTYGTNYILSLSYKL